MKNYMKTHLKIGAHVRWKWMGGYVRGEVIEEFLEPVTKVIKGKNIKRNGSPEKPAYLVKSEAGNYALKLATELEAVEKLKARFDL